MWFHIYVSVLLRLPVILAKNSIFSGLNLQPCNVIPEGFWCQTCEHVYANKNSVLRHTHSGKGFKLTFLNLVIALLTTLRKIFFNGSCSDQIRCQTAKFKKIWFLTGSKIMKKKSGSCFYMFDHCWFPTNAYLKPFYWKVVFGKSILRWSSGL